MSTQGPQSQARVKGRRPIRHYVRVTPEQEVLLQAAARSQGVTVAKLLVDSALDAKPSRRAILMELAGIRRMMSTNPPALEWLDRHYGFLDEGQRER